MGGGTQGNMETGVYMETVDGLRIRTDPWRYFEMDAGEGLGLP